MHGSETEALDALAAVCEDVYRRALANLQLLVKKKTLFSNPYKQIEEYPLDAISRALEIAGPDGDKYIILGSTSGTNVDYSAHERLMNLATQMLTCNALQEKIDQTMKNNLLSPVLLAQTQSIAILSTYVNNFSMLSSEYIRHLRNKIDGTGTEPTMLADDLTVQFMNSLGEDIMRLKGHWVDVKQAGQLVMSLTLPLRPAIIRNMQQPDGRVFNGIWMTVEMESQLISHLAKQQAAGMAEH